MRKISPDAVNAIIDACKIENDDTFKIPRIPKYREDVFLDYISFIDNQMAIEDLIRETLPFFANNPDMDFPVSFFYVYWRKSKRKKF